MNKKAKWVLTQDGIPENGKDGYFSTTRRHKTNKYKRNPIGEIVYGLEGTCIQQVLPADKNLKIPTILVANITEENTSKRLALTV